MYKKGDQVKVKDRTGKLIDGTVVGEGLEEYQWHYWVQYEETTYDSTHIEVSIFSESELDEWLKNTGKCECGNDSMPAPSPRHPYYCPKFNKNS